MNAQVSTVLCLITVGLISNGFSYWALGLARCCICISGQVTVLNQMLMLEEWRKGSLIFLDGVQEKKKLAGSSFSLHCWMYIVVLWNCGFERCLCITQHTSVYVWYYSLGLTGDVEEGWSVLFQELSMAAAVPVCAIHHSCKKHTASKCLRWM